MVSIFVGTALQKRKRKSKEETNQHPFHRQEYF